jgi:pyruvate, water dikinase
MQAPGLTGVISESMAGARSGGVPEITSAAQTIADAMRSISLPAELRAEIASRYSEVAGATGVSEPPVAVRSSALGEDSEEATFAGQQETYLWIQGVESVCDAVRHCWVSLYSTTAVSYRARLGQAHEEAAMGVTVQLMVDAERSEVMFTCNPLSGDRSMIAINASWGLGLAVVGGEVTPDDYLVSKVTRAVVREKINPKQVEYVPDPHGPADRRDARCLDEDSIAALVAVGRRVERHFGAPQDIEWAIARTGEPPDNLFVLQSRPVTALPEQPKKQMSGSSAISLVMGTFGADRTGRDS